jgi:cytochrome c oxidase cbb3-type subunit 1
MQSQTYNYKVVRQFAIMTVVWGIVGMLVGVIAAAQLVWPELNFAEWFHFGRLRPLHTNAVIFAFGGCAPFCNVLLLRSAYQSHPSLWSGPCPLPSGAGKWSFFSPRSRCRWAIPGKEYAELEWPIDILITLVWVSYAIVFFGTIGTRKVPISMWQTGFTVPSS